MSTPSQRNYDNLHAANLEKYAKQVRSAYLNVIKELSKLSVGINLNAKNEFFFRNHSSLNRVVNALLIELQSEVYGTTVLGINTEWDLAVEKHNDLAVYALGTEIDKVPKSVIKKYFSTNAGARRNFLARKENGLGLSDRIWKNTQQFKTELELALEYGIGNGKSAASISRDVRKYLNDPEMLFRRVRNANGELRLSKATKSYHPGQGRYRSSYKNALRLTANETNFSYEGSADLKRQQQDFIVGIKIMTSPRHKASDDKGGISCIRLQGLYPKDFKWTYKWHVNCRCMSLNVMKTREELDKDNDLILAGKEPNTKSENEVKGVPKEYAKESKAWLEKSKNWKNQPRTFANNQ